MGRELPGVFWAYRATQNTSTGETLFSLAFRTDAIISAEIGIPCHRTAYFDETENASLIASSFDLVKEKKGQSRTEDCNIPTLHFRFIRQEGIPQIIQERGFSPMKGNSETRIPLEGSFGVNWEGPYRINKSVGSGAY